MNNKKLIDARKGLALLAEENPHSFEGVAAKLILLNYGLLAADNN